MMVIFGKVFQVYSYIFENIVIESAGNNNDNQPSYLGSRADCLSIAAVTPGDSKASFSTYGTWVDLSAPGTGIYTTAFNRSASGAADCLGQNRKLHGLP